MKRYRPAIILGAVALILVVVTVIMLSRGNSEYGLYVSAASGDTQIGTSDTDKVPLVADVFVKKGDVITVGDSGSCTLIYRSKDNLDENYAILSANSQMIVSDDFNGRADGTLFLSRGKLLVNSTKKAKCNIIVRTDGVSATTKEAVLFCDYDELDSAVTLTSFSGDVVMQLYNNLGTPIDANGNLNGPAQGMRGGTVSRVLCGLQGNNPTFDYAGRADVDLTSYDAVTLKNLITLAAFHDLAFTSQELKNAYDDLPAEVVDESEEPGETETETETETTTETTPPTEETSEETSSEETTTEETTAEKPEETQAPATAAETQRTTARQTAAATERRTEARTTAANRESVGAAIDVPPEDDIGDIVDIGPDDGYDDNGGLVDDDDGMLIDDGDGGLVDDDDVSLDDDSSLEDDMSGDSSFDAPQDIYDDSEFMPTVETIAKSNTHTVTFVIDGQRYQTTVEDGGQAVPPFSPGANSMGSPFLGWDQSLSNITADVTINAMY